MAYVQSHTVLIRHRKLVYLAEILGIPPVHALGHIHALWHVVLEQAEDGDVTGWTEHFLSTSACWTGDASVFVAKLRESGWLDGSLFHDWLDYAGAYLTAKYKEINVAYLREIWRKHGRTYGKRKGSRKEVNRKLRGSEKEHIPSLPILSSPLPSSSKKDLLESFQIFYEAYPRKTSRQAAVKAWMKLSPENGLVETIMAALEKAKASDQWTRDGGKFIPYPASWLNGARWEDESFEAGDGYDVEAVARAIGWKGNT